MPTNASLEQIVAELMGQFGYVVSEALDQRLAQFDALMIRLENAVIDAEGKVTDKPKRTVTHASTLNKHEQNDWYDVVKDIWGYTAARNGAYVKFLRGVSDKAGYAEANLEPPTTPDELREWATWWRAQNADMTMIASPEKVQDSIYAFRQVREQRSFGPDHEKLCTGMALALGDLNKQVFSNADYGENDPATYTIAILRYANDFEDRTWENLWAMYLRMIKRADIGDVESWERKAKAQAIKL